MKRTAVVAVILTMLAGAAACGGGGSEGPGGSTHKVNQATIQGSELGQKLDLSKLSPSIKDPSQPVTITFASWVGSSPLMQKLAKQFHQIHPNISIKFEDVPAESMQTKLTTQIAGGNAPDAAYVDSGTVGSFGPRGALVQLDDYISKSKGVVASDYVPAFRTMNEWQGHMYGLPYDGESTALFYRTDLLKAAGITSPPKTWAEMQADAAKLTIPAKKQYGIALFATQGETSYYYYPFLYQAGGTQTIDNDTKIGYDSTAGKKAAEFYVGLRKYSPSDLWASNSWDGRVSFATGKVGMYIAGAWFAGEMNNSYPKIKGKWAVAPLPTETAGSQCATTIAGDSLVILSQSKNQDAAWKWIEFLSAPQNMALWNIGTKKAPSSLLPPRTSLLNNPHVFDNNPVLAGFADNMKCGITDLSQNPNWGKVDAGPLSDALAQGIYGKEDVGKAFDSSASQANDMLSAPS